MRYPSILLPLVVLVLVSSSQSYHVLFHHNWGTKSHLIHFAPMVEELLHRGHHATAIIFNTLKIRHENYTEILVPNGVESWTDKLDKVVMDTGDKSQWRVKLDFWMSLIQMRGGLYDEVGLRPMRNEQGGCKNRLGTTEQPIGCVTSLTLLVLTRKGNHAT